MNKKTFKYDNYYNNPFQTINENINIIEEKNMINNNLYEINSNETDKNKIKENTLNSESSSNDEHNEYKDYNISSRRNTDITLLNSKKENTKLTVNNSIIDKNDLQLRNIHKRINSSNSNSILIPKNNLSSKHLKQKNKNYRNFIYFKGEKMKIISNPLEYLNKCKTIIVEQKFDILEILSGCENPNKYHVYSTGNLNEKNYLFKCSEISNCLCRNFCSSSSKKFSLIFQYPSKYNKSKKTFAIFSKEFNCNLICCCKKNEMIGGLIKDKNQSYKKIGKINEKSNGCYCNPYFVIQNEKDKIKYKISTEYYQTGFFCRGNALGKCYEVDFLIYDKKTNINKKNSKPIGIIHKYYQGLSELVGDADAYLINFPQNASAYEKLLIIGGTIMIDYIFFEKVSWCECNCV
jgi:hypothetical protein